VITKNKIKVDSESFSEDKEQVEGNAVIA